MILITPKTCKHCSREHIQVPKENRAMTQTPIIKQQLKLQSIVDMFLELMIVNNISYRRNECF